MGKDWEVESPRIVDYTPVERKSLRLLVGKIVIIKGVEFRHGRRGDYAVIVATVEGEEGEYYTFSKVVLDQLKAIKKILDSGNYVRAKVCLDRQTLRLCSPRG